MNNGITGIIAIGAGEPIYKIVTQWLPDGEGTLPMLPCTNDAQGWEQFFKNAEILKEDSYEWMFLEPETMGTTVTLTINPLATNPTRVLLGVCNGNPNLTRMEDQNGWFTSCPGDGQFFNCVSASIIKIPKIPVITPSMFGYELSPAGAYELIDIRGATAWPSFTPKSNPFKGIASTHMTLIINNNIDANGELHVAAFQELNPLANVIVI